MRIWVKIIQYLKDRPRAFKQAWKDFKLFAKTQYKINKLYMDDLLGIEREAKLEDGKKK